MKTLLRIAVQFVMAGPIFLLGGLAWPFLFMPFIPGLWLEVLRGEQANFGYGLLGMAGAYGIIALPFAICLSSEFLRNRRWLKGTILFLLLGGSVTSVFCLVGIRPTPDGWANYWFRVWMFGGPLVVAIWSITGFSKRPNWVAGGN